MRRVSYCCSQSERRITYGLLVRVLVWVMFVDEGVVVEQSFVFRSVRKRHYTIPVLNSSTPLPFVGAPINHALTVTLISLKLPL